MLWVCTISVAEKGRARPLRKVSRISLRVFYGCAPFPLRSTPYRRVLELDPPPDQASRLPFHEKRSVIHAGGGLGSTCHRLFDPMPACRIRFAGLGEDWGVAAFSLEGDAVGGEAGGDAGRHR